MLKMGQEVEGEKKKRRRRWQILVYQPPPRTTPASCLFCLPFLRRRTDSVARWGQSILRAITNRPLTIRWDKKWVQLKNKSMSTILTARKNTPILSFPPHSEWLSERRRLTKRRDRENTCSTASAYFNQFPGAGFHRSLADNTLWNNATVCFSKPTWQAGCQERSAITCHINPLIGHKDLPPRNLVMLRTSSRGLQTGSGITWLAASTPVLQGGC